MKVNVNIAADRRLRMSCSYFITVNSTGMKKHLAISTGLGFVGWSRKNSSIPKVLVIVTIVAITVLLFFKAMTSVL